MNHHIAFQTATLHQCISNCHITSLTVYRTATLHHSLYIELPHYITHCISNCHITSLTVYLPHYITHCISNCHITSLTVYRTATLHHSLYIELPHYITHCITATLHHSLNCHITFRTATYYNINR